jgi:regulator of protease activity HflC (stomatin/prohibitin superfamily)
MRDITIQHGFTGLLYEDGAFVRLLGPGRHRFPRRWFGTLDRRISTVDLRERSVTIKGQEITTADKVAIRVSILVYFKVQDPAAAVHNVSSYEERIYEDVQLAARRYLASKNIEAILNDRNGISDAVRADVTGTALGYGIEIRRADVKDLVFPGNLREIMNQVLETERRAEAKVIEAKKDAEVAKLRSHAEGEAAMAKLTTEREQALLRAQAEQDTAKLRLDIERQQAELMRQHPEMLALRRLEVFRELAKSGAKLEFRIGGSEFESVLVDKRG